LHHLQLVMIKHACPVWFWCVHVCVIDSEARTLDTIASAPCHMHQRFLPQRVSNTAPNCRRFGNVTSCDIIRDYKTGDSLCYGFIGYDNDAACEAAYFKMNNVLIDDRWAVQQQGLVGLWRSKRLFACSCLQLCRGRVSVQSKVCSVCILWQSS
jgi:hypothetical protein